MDTLRDRLADLAQDAPTGGVPAADLWARGKRAHRFRVAGAAAALLVVGAVGTGIGARLAEGDSNRSDLEPADSLGITLPIDYPIGEELPDLGNAPGPLAAIWVIPRAGGGTPEVVGLVARTGTFGTLPINVSRHYGARDAYFALSPDGRRIAFDTPAEELVVRDLVSGESYSPAFEKFTPRRAGDGSYTWVDATHLVGYVAPEAGTRHVGSEGDEWVWEPGTTPKLIGLMDYPGTPYLGPHAGMYEHPWFLTNTEGDPRTCLSLQDVAGGTKMPVLCDLVGVLGPKVALTHDGDGAVVALDAAGVEDPALRRMVETAGGPLRVTFATDLIQTALDADGGAS